MQKHPKATLDLLRQAKKAKGLAPEAERVKKYIIAELTTREREDEDVRHLTDSLRRIMREHTRSRERR